MVEKNARSIRANYYAGGSAFTIADMSGKSCSGPADNFSGLFSIGGTYCGGTYYSGVGEDKSTAFRVRTHHFYY